MQPLVLRVKPVVKKQNGPTTFHRPINFFWCTRFQIHLPGNKKSLSILLSADRYYIPVHKILNSVFWFKKKMKNILLRISNYSIPAHKIFKPVYWHETKSTNVLLKTNSYSIPAHKILILASGKKKNEKCLLEDPHSFFSDT